MNGNLSREEFRERTGITQRDFYDWIDGKRRTDSFVPQLNKRYGISGNDDTGVFNTMFLAYCIQEVRPMGDGRILVEYQINAAGQTRTLQFNEKGLVAREVKGKRKWVDAISSVGNHTNTRIAVSGGRSHLMTVECLAAMCYGYLNHTLMNTMMGINANVKDCSGSDRTRGAWNIKGLNISENNLEWCTADENKRHYSMQRWIYDITGGVYEISAFDSEMAAAYRNKDIQEAKNLIKKNDYRKAN